MMQTKRIAPPYSILNIGDPNAEGTLDPSRDHIVWSDSAVRISCLNEFDGETRVTLGVADLVAPSGAPAFDAVIKTPSRRVAIVTAHLETLMVAKVSGDLTRIRIWENDPVEPDDIIIALG